MGTKKHSNKAKTNEQMRLTTMDPHGDELHEKFNLGPMGDELSEKVELMHQEKRDNKEHKEEAPTSPSLDQKS